MIGASIGLFGAVVTFFPPENPLSKLCLLLSFAAFTAALLLATHRQQAAAAAQAAEEAVVAKAEAEAALRRAVAAALEPLTTQVVKRERDVIREGSVKLRALYMSQQMLQLLAARNKIAFRADEQGQTHIDLPDEKWTNDTRNLFAAQFAMAARDIVQEMRECGVTNQQLDASLKLYPTLDQHMVILAWSLYEAASKMRDSLDVPF